MEESKNKDYLEITDECCFSQFKLKMDEWKHNLIDKDNQNSVLRQLEYFIWIFCAYSVIDQIKRDAENNKNPEIGFNNTVFHLFKEGFFRTQIVGIRSMIDKRNDVISLRRIIDDMCDNAHIITRANYIAYFDQPYNYEEAERKYKKIYSGPVLNPPGNGECAFMSSKRLHNHFDNLSGINKKNRNRLDIIAQQKFIDWKSRLSACNKVKEFANKHLCHLSNDNNLNSINLDDIKSCIKVLFIIIKEMKENIFVPNVLYFEKYVFVDFDVENFSKRWIATDQDAQKLVETKVNEIFNYIDR